MKLITSSLLVGAAIAASPVQNVLQLPKQLQQLPKHLQQSLQSMTWEERVVWDEITEMYPEAMEKATSMPRPKKHTRRPDSHWDHITKGADVQSLWVENESGGKEREIDGELEAYNLRSRKVDPSILGIDPGVKQYSGYLDDEENDKHLFYCKSTSLH